MNKLKPCPLCGGYAKVRKYGTAYAVQCNDCGVTTRKIYRNGGVSPCVVQNMVIDLWNRRTKL